MSIEIFRGTHYDVGRGIGAWYQRQIQRALRRYVFLHETLLPYHATSDGQARFHRLRDLHQRRFPGFYAELHGLADGAQLPFEHLLLVNLRGEYRRYVTEPEEFGCSTVALVNYKTAALGHNEDGSPVFLGETYLVRAEINGKIPFTAFCYPGFLPGNAFGVNDAGVFFSINNVNPVDIQEGIGRHFIARSLFEARSIEEAHKLVTIPRRGSGFHYNIGSVPERRIASLEVAPEADHIREVEGLNFHANHYLYLPDIPQTISASSDTRQKRGEALFQTQPPKSAEDILALLRDRDNPDYPICRTASEPDDTATLATALFDLDARTLTVYPPGGDLTTAPEVIAI